MSDPQFDGTPPKALRTLLKRSVGFNTAAFRGGGLGNYGAPQICLLRPGNLSLYKTPRDLPEAGKFIFIGRARMKEGSTLFHVPAFWLSGSHDLMLLEHKCLPILAALQPWQAVPARLPLHLPLHLAV